MIEAHGRTGGTNARRAVRTLLSGLFLALTLAGCASIDMPAPAPATPQIPGEAPRTTGVETRASAEHRRLVAQFGGEYRAPSVERYLDAILARLAPASDTPAQVYHVTLLNTPIVNAFALPSGDLYVTRGLLALANDTAEVAAVMAHEIGHVTAGHAAQRAELEKTNAVVSRAARTIQSPQRGEEVQATGRLSIAGFSRKQELEADQIGVRTIAKAGYDPYGASRFLASLGRSTALRASLLGLKNGDDRPDLSASHPSTPERISAATAAARQIAAPGSGAADRAEYLGLIDGIDFGDDPSDGLVRGRRFIHPKLGFSFTAPEGFSLENSAQAVLGVAGGGLEALRLDNVPVPAATPLETYVASGWIEGLRADTIQTTMINGLPAVVAVAKGGEWTFRLAAIRVGADVYRLIFATRNLDEDTDRRFRDAIGTFHRLSPDEATDVKPLKLTIVKAGPGDTAEGMAARMAVADRQLEFFLLLNGLEKGGALRTGERYKLVTE